MIFPRNNNYYSEKRRWIKRANQHIFLFLDVNIKANLLFCKQKGEFCRAKFSLSKWVGVCGGA